MHLDLIIKNWPANTKHHSQWTRVTRAAKKALETDDVSSSMEVTEEEMRLIIRAIPARAEGVEEAYMFLALHEGFPAQEWVRMCDASSPRAEEDLEGKIEALQRQIKALEEENRKIKGALRKIAP